MLIGAWPHCSVPTRGMWSSGDRNLTEARTQASGKRVDAAWEHRRSDDGGGWIPLQCPETVIAAALEWFGRPPLAPAAG